MPLSRQQFVDYIYPEVNDFLLLQHQGRDAEALEGFDAWLPGKLAELDSLAAAGDPLAAELREAVFYRCLLLRAGFCWRLTASEDHEARCAITRQLAQTLELAAQTETGRLNQAYARLALMVTAYNDFEVKPTVAEILAALDALPEEYRDQQIWHHMSIVAYDYGLLTLLETAFEHETLHPHSKYPQASWQRLNLMYQIMTGKVSRRDVEETIKVMFLPTQFEEFRRRMCPALREAGLFDAEMEQRLQQREAEAAAAELDFHQSRVDSVRTHAPD